MTDPSPSASTDPSARSFAHLPLYRQRGVAMGYDLLNSLLWFPHGSDALRRDLVDDLDLAAHHRVLEIGCGTGLVTRHLATRTASVIAVEQSATMAAAARRRAPSAEIRVGSLGSSSDDDSGALTGTFDRVVLSFVLHEMAPPDRIRVLRAARDVLAVDGLIGVLEWATPTRAVSAALWRMTVRTIEPAVAHDVLDDGLDIAFAAARLIVERDQRRAAGRARMIRLHPAPSPPTEEP